MLQAIRVLAIAAIFRAAAGLHVGALPWLGAKRSQKRGRVRGARADFHVVGLKQRAALVSPVGLEFQNDLLKSKHVVWLQAGSGFVPGSNPSHGFA